MQRHKTKPPTWQIPRAAIWILGALALATRLALFPYVSGDSTYHLLPWMNEFRDHGIAALGGEFSNYNFPYLFLMFLGSLLPVEPLYAIKTISLLGDFVLAASVGAVVAQLRPPRLPPATAALIALFLPTVLLNGSMWGQCDSIYTSFLLLSLRSLLRNQGGAAWAWWAIALSFKLQAVFFLPALVVISIRSRYAIVFPALAASLWVVLSAPPVLFGRSLSSTMGVYFRQTQEDSLVAGAANVYAWLPTVSAADGRIPAILVCCAALLLTARAYWLGPDSAERRVLFTVAALAVCPLLLPQMHDRYFFAAEVVSLLLLGRKKLSLVPVLFAATGLLVYCLYFAANVYLWPFQLIASVVQCFAVATLVSRLWRATDQNLILPVSR
jgi:hypothetical protein